MKSRPTKNSSRENLAGNDIDYNERELIMQVLHDSCHVLGVSHIDLKHLSIVPLPGGSINLNYRVSIKNKHFFLKHQVKTVLTYKKSIEREYRVLSYLSSKNATTFAPKPLYFDDANNILITEYVSGEKPILDQKIAPKFTKKMQAIMKVLNNVDLHFLQDLCTNTRISPALFWKKYAKPRLRLFQKDVLVCEGGSTELCNILYQVESAINTKLAEINEDEGKIDWETEIKPWWLSLIHNDFALRNVIKTTRKSPNAGEHDFFIIDWEFADAGSMAYDLAFFAVEHQVSVDYVLQFLPTDIKPEQKTKIKQHIVIFMPLIDLINAWSILNKLKEYKALQDQWLSGAALLDASTHVTSTKPHILSMMPYTIDQGLQRSLYRLKQLNHHLGIEYDSTRLFHEAQAILNYFKTKVALY